MKVINSWDLPEEPTMNSRCADCNYEDCRCDRPPMPAASPWRTDVENAPKDTECQLWCKLHPANNGHDIRIGKFDSRSKTWTDGVWQLYVTAFATINPPEIEG